MKRSITYLAILTALMSFSCPNPVSQLSSENAILDFSFSNPPSIGTISGTSISIVVPFGTNVSNLVATFTTNGASIRIGSVPQVSGISVNDFTSPVIYKVTADDGSVKEYTVTVTIASNTAKDITSFGFLTPLVSGVITGTEISVTVPFGTDISSLIAVFTTTGIAVTVDSTTQASGVTVNNFTSSKTYLVTAGDSSTKEYIVSVSIAPAVVYAAGYSYDETGTQHPGYWQDGIWNPVTATGIGYSEWGTSLTAVTVSGEDIYVAGNCRYYTAERGCYWKNGAFTPLPMRIAYSIILDGDDVYVGGSAEDGTPGYCVNGNWVSLPKLSMYSSNVYSLFKYDSDIYAAGFSIDESSHSRPGYWKNEIWVELPRITPSSNGEVTTIVVNGVDVYAGGVCSDTDGNSVAGYWLNGTWNQLPQLSTIYPSRVTCMLIYNGNVYAGGLCFDSSHVAIPGYWLNGVWIALPSLSGRGDHVTSLSIIAGDIYAGGAGLTDATKWIAGYWKNGVWNPLPGLSAQSSYVNSIIVK